MRILHVSDLHLDNAMAGGPHGWFGGFDFAGHAGSPEDTLVIVGDTGEHVDDTIDFLNAAATRFRSVVAVWGNHETGSPTHARAPNVHILDLTPDGLHIDDDQRVGYVGGCLAPTDSVPLTRTERGLRRLEASSAVERIVVVSHFVPTARIGRLIGRDIRTKCNDLLERFAPAHVKPTTVAFGHLHIEVEVMIAGVCLVSNPRGYRKERRDGSVFRDFKELPFPPMSP